MIMRSSIGKVRQYFKTILSPKQNKALRIIRETEEFKKLSKNHWWISACKVKGYGELYKELKLAIDKSDKIIHGEIPMKSPFKPKLKIIQKANAKIKSAMLNLDRESEYCEMAIASSTKHPDEVDNSTNGLMQYFYVDLNHSKVILSGEGNWVACDFTGLRGNA